ncbi:protein kinase [Listeria seeligeri]|uniref:protein kinase domain-containing protein n=1 Tax=Listeria seeligeri TaxID=1640 RepID=UPI00162A281B|nr:protein kinase [Listeria seeligeri]MBC1585697.1 protein kinase [Listeria seeligeri]MBC1599763.1 protein kinase [Listeria seeligeri]
MDFKDIIESNLKSISGESETWTFSKNKKRGQSDTFTICNSSNEPIYIAKFFDYLVDLKREIDIGDLNAFENLDDLLENIDSLDGIDDVSDRIESFIDYILFQQRCFKRYVVVCQLSNLECFPLVTKAINELKLNNSFYGFLIEVYVNGVTLEKHLPFPEGTEKAEKAFEFLQQLGNVIEKLNSNGIVHRDISPDNIIYKNGDYIVIDPGMVKLSDDSPVTKSKMMMGKAFYASPEQYFGNAKMATFKSDLYAIGIIALEMIVGYNPLEKIFIGEGHIHPPHNDLLKKVDREIEDDYYDNVDENEFTSRLLLIIKKLLQIEDNLRFDTVDSFIISLNSLKERVV